MAKCPTPLLLSLVLLAAVSAAGVWYLDSGQHTRDDGDAVLFRLGGQEFRREDLALKYALPFHEAENNAYKLQQRILQSAIIDTYITRLMGKSGDDWQTVYNRLFDLSPPTEAEMKQFYADNRARISGSYEEARAEIGAYLQRTDMQRQQQELVAKLLSLKELEVNLRPPHTPVVELDTDGYPARGPEDARVTLVEFSDYQCPHCKKAHAALAQYLPPYLDRVRFVFMDFPINRSGISRRVAEGAVCAQHQGRFWEYQELAFERQTQLEEGSALAIARALDLDLGAFEACLAAPETAQRVEDSERQAVHAGVTGTPTFFINGRKIELHDLRGSLTDQLDQALEALR